MVKVNDILLELSRIAPFVLAANWDNVGLLIGNSERQTRSLLLALDPTLLVLDEAINRGADTLITHHPCIFHPLTSINVSIPTGAFVERALEHKMNVIACHTNFDSATPGVSDALAACLHLTELSPLRPLDCSENKNKGLGRLGSYSTPLSFASFMEKVFFALDSDTVQIAGHPPAKVRTVALCGGSGSDLAEDAFKRGADVYLSSETKHSTARWAEDIGFCIIDGTHFSTEKPAMALLGGKLKSLAQQAGWDVEILQSTFENPAFNFIHRNK